MKRYYRINEYSTDPVEQSKPNDTKNLSTAKKIISPEQRDLETFLTTFKDLVKDKKVQEFLKLADDKDAFTVRGDKSNPVSIKANLIFPSQNQIGTGQSLDDIIKIPQWAIETKKTSEPKKELESLLEGKGPVMLADPSGKNPVIVAKVPAKSGGKEMYWVIDGHHRWSKGFMANPETELGCVVFEPKSKIDIVQVLKAFHLAIFNITSNYLDDEERKPKHFKGENLLEKSVDYVKKYVVENAQDEMLEVWKKNIKEIVSKETLAEHIGKHVTMIQEKMPTKLIGSQTPRIVMPQTGVDLENITKDLQAPQVNILPESKVIKTYEKFINKWKKGQIHR